MAEHTSPGAVEDTNREWNLTTNNTLHLWQDLGAAISLVVIPVICSLPGTCLAGKGELV